MPMSQARSLRSSVKVCSCQILGTAAWTRFPLLRGAYPVTRTARWAHFVSAANTVSLGAARLCRIATTFTWLRRCRVSVGGFPVLVRITRMWQVDGLPLSKLDVGQV